MPQRTHENGYSGYLQWSAGNPARLGAVSPGLGWQTAAGVRVYLHSHQPTQVAGPMTFSDLEHFPFDQRRAAEPAAAGTGSAAPPNEAPPASRDARIFRDGNGVTWWVHEVSGEHLGTAGAMCLLVVSASELRRVWKYPSDWRSLTPEQLLKLPQAKSYAR